MKMSFELSATDVSNGYLSEWPLEDSSSCDNSLDSSYSSVAIA